MNQSLLFSRLYYILFYISVLSIPFTSLILFFTTPLLLVLWVIEGRWKDKRNRLKEPRTLIITGTLILFWLTGVIGVLYSNDIVKGLMRTYDKLPFLVYPLVFFSIDKAYFTKEKLYRLFKGFIFATVLMLLICWGNSVRQYLISHNTYHFYYVYLSQYFGHPTYCSVKVCIAFIITFYFFNDSKRNHIWWIWLSFLLFFAASIYFLQSRGGILAFIIVLFFSLFYYFYTHQKTIWQVVRGILIILLGCVIFIEMFPGRVGAYIQTMNEGQLQSKNIWGARSEIWSLSYQLAMKHKVLGIGTGYHNNSYLTDSEFTVIDKNSSFINTHNQYLQTFLEHGIFGLSIFLFLLIYSFYLAIKTKNYLLFMLITVFNVNMFFESMLERSHGIFTFCLFFCLFILKEIIESATPAHLVGH